MRAARDAVLALQARVAQQQNAIDELLDRQRRCREYRNAGHSHQDVAGIRAHRAQRDLDLFGCRQQDAETQSQASRDLRRGRVRQRSEVVAEVLIGVANAHHEVLKHPAPESFFLGFGDSSLDFELRAWVAAGD